MTLLFIAIYLVFSLINSMEDMRWFSKFVAFFGMLILSVLSLLTEIFNNGAESVQLAIVIACIEVIDLWFEKHSRPFN